MQQGKATGLGIMIMNDAKSYTAVLKTVKRLLNCRSKPYAAPGRPFPSTTPSSCRWCDAFEKVERGGFCLG